MEYQQIHETRKQLKKAIKELLEKENHNQSLVDAMVLRRRLLKYNYIRDRYGYDFKVGEQVRVHFREEGKWRSSKDGEFISIKFKNNTDGEIFVMLKRKGAEVSVAGGKNKRIISIERL